MTLRHPPGLSPDGFELVGSLAIPRTRLRGTPPLALEAVLLRLTAIDGWQSRWLGSGLSSTEEGILDAAPRDALRAVAEMRGSYVGVWDLLAWRDEQVLFIAPKSAGTSAVSEAQAGWLAAALVAGFTPEDFLVAEQVDVRAELAALAR